MKSRRSRSDKFVIADGLHMNDWGYACAQLLGDDIIKSVGQIKLSDSTCRPACRLIGRCDWSGALSIAVVPAKAGTIRRGLAVERGRRLNLL